MEQLDFTFKKTRKFGDLFSDYIALFKMIFKHFNKSIITIALPFFAIAFLLSFFVTEYVRRFAQEADLIADDPMLFVTIFGPFLLLGLIFFLVISVFGIEYMILLEGKGNTDFTVNDIARNIKQNIGKYIAFYFASLVVGLVLIIPIGIVMFVVALIPILNFIALGALGGMIAIFYNNALMLYRESRYELFTCYIESFKLLGKNIFSYGLAAYLFQMLVQVVLGIVAIIPGIVIFFIGFALADEFSNNVFNTVTGKLLISLGGILFVLIIVFMVIYLISFYVLQYFSLLETTYSENTLDEIDNIGNTSDEF